MINYQWYPGHMTKAKRMMQENVKLIDLIIELVDARIPMSSRNPDIDILGKGKARLILMNKSDLADTQANTKWEVYFKNKGYYVLPLNSKNGNGMKAVQQKVREACSAKIEKDRKKGIINRPVRAMVVGIPNVGKSTFINAFAGKACTKTGNKPGVTKGKQWIRISNELELLDTPGILWPKFEDQSIGEKLALIGSINDEILSVEDMAFATVKFMLKFYPERLSERYNIDPDGAVNEADKVIDLNIAGVDNLEEASVVLNAMDLICEKRGCLKKGKGPDYKRVSGMIMDDFRSGKLGKITLELPE